MIKGLFVSVLAVVLLPAQSFPESPIPSDSEIRKILAERIDKEHQSVGIVVGIIEPKGHRLVTYGGLDKGDPRPLSGDTVFEIGSVTKVFTSLLLADMVERGEVALADPVAKYLPASVKVPQRGGRAITLQDLATHTSGLPRLPANLTPKDQANPYADYSVEQLYQFLSTYELTRDIGSTYEYSNLGGGLLGHTLARRAGMDYETLVKTRICAPLEMTSTGITLTPEMKTRLAVGHDASMVPVPNWDLPTLAGAGALRSTANDMLSFIAANLGYKKSTLAPAMAAMLKIRRPTGSPGLDIALGWHIFTHDGNDIIWHNGGTGGYRSFVGYDAKARAGVVVLSNAETNTGVDDIGHHLLDKNFPLAPPPQAHKEITVDPKLFDSYIGRYQLAPDFILTITREGSHLFAQATKQPKFEIYPETDRDYFLKVVDAQVTFVPDEKGRAKELILHQNGQNQRATRIEGEVPPPPSSKEHKETTVDPKLFDGYIGRYELAPNFILTVTREDSHLFLQATGQPKFEVYPESDRQYFLKVVDAQITFEGINQGKATSLILHQNGVDQSAKRIE
jgi:D-alanyl-D-alanine-carboxypeptidase/D-alanyl-D-alanine-endopeptidase